MLLEDCVKEMIYDFAIDFPATHPLEDKRFKEYAA
jgi:hypothetical protein